MPSLPFPDDLLQPLNLLGGQPLFSQQGGKQFVPGAVKELIHQLPRLRRLDRLPVYQGAAAEVSHIH